MEILPITTEEREKLAGFLAGLRDTSMLLKREVLDFVDYCDLIEPTQDEIIVDIGQVSDGLYIVLSGETRLESQVAGSGMVVSHLDPGEMFGESSFFDGRPRELRLRACAGSRMLRIRRPMFERLRLERPLLAVMLLEVAIVSLDTLYRRISADMTELNRYIHRTGK